MDKKTETKKTSSAEPAVSSDKKVVVNTCPITGEKVVGAGVGVSYVDNYEVHFCCGGCKPAFDKMTKTQQLEKIKTVIAKG